MPEYLVTLTSPGKITKTALKARLREHLQGMEGVRFILRDYDKVRAGMAAGAKTRTAAQKLQAKKTIGQLANGRTKAPTKITAPAAMRKSGTAKAARNQTRI